MSSIGLHKDSRNLNLASNALTNTNSKRKLRAKKGKAFYAINARSQS